MTLIERVAGKHLPDAHQGSAQLVAHIFELDECAVMLRAGLRVDLVANGCDGAESVTEQRLHCSKLARPVGAQFVGT